MSEVVGPEIIKQSIHEAKRQPSKRKKLAVCVSSVAAASALIASSFIAANQAIIRDLASFSFDQEDEVVFAINGIEEPDEIRQISTDDVRERVAHVRSSSNLSDKDGRLIQVLKNYLEQVDTSLPLNYLRFLHNFDNYPLTSTVSEKNGINYTVYGDTTEPVWQDYASTTFSTDLVEAIEYSLRSHHTYENERVQFIQDGLIERTVDNQELAGEYVRVFIPGEPSCLESGAPVSLLEDPERNCDASGARRRDMSVRGVPHFNTTGFDNVIILAGARPTNPNGIRFEQLATHGGNHRIHFTYGYKNNPRDQDAIENNVKYIEYEIFDSGPGNRNLDHSPTSLDEPLIDYEQLYKDYLPTEGNTTSMPVDEVPANEAMAHANDETNKVNAPSALEQDNASQENSRTLEAGLMSSILIGGLKTPAMSADTVAKNRRLG